MNRSIGPLWIIGLILKLSFRERYFEFPARLVDCGSGILVLRENRVELVNQSFRQISLTGHTIYDQLSRGFLVS